MENITRGYKAKTIRSVISRKVAAWLATIDDESLSKDLADGVVVTGGCIASMLLGERVSDFDVYLRTSDLARRVAKHYVARFKPKKHKGIEVKLWVQCDGDRVKVVAKSAGVASEDGADADYRYFESQPDEAAGAYVGEVMAGVTTDPEEIDDLAMQLEDGTKEAASEEANKKPEYRPIFISSNAITLSDRVQIVLRFTGDPDSIHANYDFVHCTNHWASWGKPQLTLRKEALEALLARELRYVGSLYPLCSIIRTRKFLKRGWTINAGQYLKMAMQVADLDLTDPKILEDQLTGVDVAYFAQLLATVAKRDDTGTKITTAYIVEIVDRIF
jgi:hypothetical protein